MKSPKSYLKRIIPCVVLALVLLLLFFFNSSNTPPTHVIIPDDIIPLGDKIQVKASFYLYNPSQFTPDFSNVTPDLADYVGEGIVYFSNDIYNSPGEIRSLIVQEPDYTSVVPSDKAIEWGTIDKYNSNDEICVVGLCTEKGNVSYPEIIADEPDNSSTENNPIFSSITVRDFGARGDGITDDTAAIKNAISKSSDGKIYFPSGTYVISSAIRIPSNTQLIGENNDTIILAAPGTTRGATMLIIRDSSSIVLKNIGISGNSSVNYENMDPKDGIHLLDIWNSENITIDNCRFIDNIYAAIRDVASSNITISNCKFKNTDCGFVTLGNGDIIHDITITNNTFDSHEFSEPVSLYANSQHKNILIEENTMSNKYYGCGILIPGKQPNNNIIIRDNSIKATASGMRIENSSNVQVINNSVSDTTSGGALKFINCNAVIVENNTCTNIQLDGLQVTNCSDLKINNLTTVNCGLKNQNFFNIRFSGEKNDNISFSNSNVKYDNPTTTIGICFDCPTDISMENISYNNASIWLTKRSSNTSLSVPASVKIIDQGQGNTVTKH